MTGLGYAPSAFADDAEEVETTEPAAKEPLYDVTEPLAASIFFDTDNLTEPPRGYINLRDQDGDKTTCNYKVDICSAKIGDIVKVSTVLNLTGSDKADSAKNKQIATDEHYLLVGVKDLYLIDDEDIPSLIPEGSAKEIQDAFVVCDHSIWDDAKFQNLYNLYQKYDPSIAESAGYFGAQMLSTPIPISLNDSGVGTVTATQSSIESLTMPDERFDISDSAFCYLYEAGVTIPDNRTSEKIEFTFTTSELPGCSNDSYYEKYSIEEGEWDATNTYVTIERYGESFENYTFSYHVYPNAYFDDSLPQEEKSALINDAIKDLGDSKEYQTGSPISESISLALPEGLNLEDYTLSIEFKRFEEHTHGETKYNEAEGLVYGASAPTKIWIPLYSEKIPLSQVVARISTPASIEPTSQIAPTGDDTVAPIALGILGAVSVAGAVRASRRK